MKTVIMTVMMGIAFLVVQVPPVWCDNSSGECMEKCLAPALETGDPAAIEAAITACKAQCLPLTTTGAGTLSMSGYERGRCIANCASQNRQCLITKRSPTQCHLAYENCKRGCR